VESEEGTAMATKTLKAKYKNGTLTLLAKVDLPNDA